MSAKAPLLAPVLAIVSTVLASVAPTADASSYDRGCAGHGGRSCNWPTAKHAGSADSSSTQHLRLLP
jgi:hypothetical protein